MAPGPARSRLQKVAQARQDSKDKEMEEQKKKDINSLMSMVESHYENLNTEIRSILMGIAASNHSNVEIALKDPEFLHKMVSLLQICACLLVLSCVMFSRFIK